jgi:large subunit ribosomal protein L24
LQNLKGTKRSKLRKNDQVVVIAGRDKGKRGRVLAVAPDKGKIKIEGAGMIKRHQKPAGNRGGGIIDKESWLDISNVQIVDPQSGKPSRLRYQIEGDTKTRVAAASGHAVETK